jgi:hypothetical protein
MLTVAGEQVLERGRLLGGMNAVIVGKYLTTLGPSAAGGRLTR